MGKGSKLLTASGQLLIASSTSIMSRTYGTQGSLPPINPGINSEAIKLVEPTALPPLSVSIAVIRVAVVGAAVVSVATDNHHHNRSPVWIRKPDRPYRFIENPNG